MDNDLLIIELSHHERLWLEEVHALQKEAIKIGFTKIWKKLQHELPANFNPNQIDSKLIRPDGEEIHILGIVAIEKSTHFLDTIDKVIRCIGEITLNNPDYEWVSLDLIAEKTSIAIESLRWIVLMINEANFFYNSLQNDKGNPARLTAIGVGGNKDIFYNYRSYPGVRELLLQKYYAPILAEKAIRDVKEQQMKQLVSLFPESKYLSKIQFDFEDLPTLVIQKGIIWKFEGGRLTKDGEYLKWKEELHIFLQTIQPQHSIKTLQKGIEYCKSIFQYHLDFECQNLTKCPDNENWERKIALAESLLAEIQPNEPVPVFDQSQKSTSKNKGFTTARQVLAIHYLLKHNGINPVDKPTAAAKFIQFITRREENAKRIQDTTLYKKVTSPFKSKDTELIKDLEYIKPFFEELEMSSIVEAINAEIKFSRDT